MGAQTSAPVYRRGLVKVRFSFLKEGGGFRSAELYVTNFVGMGSFWLLVSRISFAISFGIPPLSSNNICPGFTGQTQY